MIRGGNVISMKWPTRKFLLSVIIASLSITAVLGIIGVLWNRPWRNRRENTRQRDRGRCRECLDAVLREAGDISIAPRGAGDRHPECMPRRGYRPLCHLAGCQWPGRCHDADSRGAVPPCGRLDARLSDACMAYIQPADENRRACDDSLYRRRRAHRELRGVPRLRPGQRELPEGTNGGPDPGCAWHHPAPAPASLRTATVRYCGGRRHCPPPVAEPFGREAASSSVTLTGRDGRKPGTSAVAAGKDRGPRAPAYWRDVRFGPAGLSPRVVRVRAASRLWFGRSAGHTSRLT